MKLSGYRSVLRKREERDEVSNRKIVDEISGPAWYRTSRIKSQGVGGCGEPKGVAKEISPKKKFHQRIFLDETSLIKKFPRKRIPAGNEGERMKVR